MDPTIIIAILSLAAKHGIPAVQEIVENWNSDTPITLDDVQNMEQRFKDPESYFKKD